MVDINDVQVDRLANFMGHHKDIHKNIYRMPPSISEMSEVSKLLMSAMNFNNNNDDGEFLGLAKKLINCVVFVFRHKC